jgi:hypothetical protein
MRLMLCNLQVNGIVLHGRCHLNASAIIKGLPGPVLQLIVLRWLAFMLFNYFTVKRRLKIYCFIIARFEPHAILYNTSFWHLFRLNRRKQAVEDLAVKPVTQFPVEISNEDAFASFKNVRHVTIKKVNEVAGRDNRAERGKLKITFIALFF